MAHYCGMERLYLPAFMRHVSLEQSPGNHVLKAFGRSYLFTSTEKRKEHVIVLRGVARGRLAYLEESATKKTPDMVHTILLGQLAPGLGKNGLHQLPHIGRRTNDNIQYCGSSRLSLE